MQANPGYALGQVAKALITSEEHEDPGIRERAKEKIAKWENVIRGMLDGSLNVGSRTPLKDIPNWVTLEVATGGFATGEFLAGGRLLGHEIDLCNRLSIEATEEARELLNAFYLSEDGIAELLSMLQNGCYEVSAPEEGALLVVAWLATNGFATEARDLVEGVAPLFAKLRFYPIPAEKPKRSGSRVFLQSVSETVESLSKIKRCRDILAQKESIEVWMPLYDKAVSLFIETVEGEAPKIDFSEGRSIVGGWPCKFFPESWRERARSILDTFNEKRAVHRLCGKPDRKKDSFAQLRRYLEVCIEDSAKLNGRDVGRIRLILARYISKRGVPGSESNEKLLIRWFNM